MIQRMKTKPKVGAQLGAGALVIRLVPVARPAKKAKASDPTIADIVRSVLEEENPEALLADGHDAALVGTAHRCSKPPLAVYSTRKIIAGLVKEGLDEEDAIEHYSFNIEGAWVGEGTPLFLADYLEELDQPDPEVRIAKLTAALRKAAGVLSGETMQKSALVAALEACKEALT